MKQQYLAATRLLDYESKPLSALIAERGWRGLDTLPRIRAIYDFVRNEIPLGYNRRDEMPASRVLRDGYGQCNTKGILLAALLRGAGIPCRIHAFYVDKTLQRGLLNGLSYRFAPQLVLHSWVEVLVQDRWVNLEGYIVDAPYLAALQQRFPEAGGAFTGYAVATDSFRDPPVEFRGENTYIQREAAVQDLGVYADPDTLFAEHRQKITGLKSFLYKNWVRKRMNKNAIRIRRKTR